MMNTMIRRLCIGILVLLALIGLVTVFKVTVFGQVPPVLISPTRLTCAVNRPVIGREFLPGSGALASVTAQLTCSQTGVDGPWMEIPRSDGRAVITIQAAGQSALALQLQQLVVAPDRAQVVIQVEPPKVQ